MTLPAYPPPRSAATTSIDVPAIVKLLDPRARSASVVLSDQRPSAGSGSGTGLGGGLNFIKSMAVLPVDPEADAEFAKFMKTLVKAVPRRVIWRR